MDLGFSIALAAVVLAAAYLLKGTLQLDQALENLRQKIESTSGVAASAATLILGLVAQLKEHAGEVDKINELADKLTAATQPLADAVAAQETPNPS